VWETQAGSRVTESGFGAKEDELGGATVDANGGLNVPVAIPDDADMEVESAPDLSEAFPERLRSRAGVVLWLMLATPTQRVLPTL
jgi:hypothetical protein